MVDHSVVSPPQVCYLTYIKCEADAQQNNDYYHDSIPAYTAAQFSLQNCMTAAKKEWQRCGRCNKFDQCALGKQSRVKSTIVDADGNTHTTVYGGESIFICLSSDRHCCIGTSKCEVFLHACAKNTKHLKLNTPIMASKATAATSEANCFYYG